MNSNDNEGGSKDSASDTASAVLDSISDAGPSKEIIALYREYIPGYLAELNQAVIDNNEEKIMFHCHKMVSAMKIMEFDHIAELLETIQTENPKGERLNTLASTVKQYIEHSLILLNQ